MIFVERDIGRGNSGSDSRNNPFTATAPPICRFPPQVVFYIPTDADADALLIPMKYYGFRLNGEIFR